MSDPEIVFAALTAADKARVLRNLKANGGIAVEQERQWIRDAHRLTRSVALGGAQSSAEVRALFWIRANGLLREIRQHVEEQLNFFKLSGPGPLAAYLLRRLNMLKAIDAVRGALTEDELLYLAYRRDVECHPWQDAYRLKVGKAGLLDERMVFGRKWKIEELDDALGKLLRSYGVDESAIATDFARRIMPAMESVLQAAEAWYPAASRRPKR